MEPTAGPEPSPKDPAGSSERALVWFSPAFRRRDGLDVCNAAGAQGPAAARQGDGALTCNNLAAEAELKAEMGKIGRESVAASNGQAATQQGMAVGATVAQGVGQALPAPSWRKASRARFLQALEAPRAAGLDRMLRLHEMHEAGCAASPAK
jgi:hypothetical protein